MIKKIYFLFALLCASSFCFGEEQPIQPKIRFSVEMVNEETAPLGLKKENVFADVMTKLIQSQIFVQEEPKNPQLILRIKTIDAAPQVVAFVQLGFFEEATLNRNNSTLFAMTWSQATLLSAAKSEFPQACQKTILQMVTSFIAEYQKAFGTPKSLNPQEQPKAQ
jgi:hypothetical protein